MLASQSPRRHQLLSSIGLEFDVRPADVDESPRAGESPIAYVERIARAKADAVAASVDVQTGAVVVLAADTTVAIDGEILGKPIDDDDARRMLGLLSDTTHQVHTAVVGHTDGDVHEVTVTTAVTFARLGEQGIEWYLENVQGAKGLDRLPYHIEQAISEG